MANKFQKTAVSMIILGLVTMVYIWNSDYVFIHNGKSTTSEMIVSGVVNTTRLQRINYGLIVNDLCFQKSSHDKQYTELVMYNVPTKYRKQLKSKTSTLQVDLKKSPVPANFRIIKDVPAIVIYANCPHNLFHSIEDLMLPLYYVMEKTNLLGSQRKYPLFHSGGSCWSHIPLENLTIITKELFIQVFPILRDIHHISLAPSNVCYQRAVLYYDNHHYSCYSDFWIPIRRRMGIFFWESPKCEWGPGD